MDILNLKTEYVENDNNKKVDPCNEKYLFCLKIAISETQHFLDLEAY